MGRFMILVVTILLAVGCLACGVTPDVPDIDINVPTIAVGEMQDERHSIPLADSGPTMVELTFGVGKLELESGASDELFSGHFRYNVERWAPEVIQRGDSLTIRQSGDEDNWGIPTGNIHNEWDLKFSPQVPFEMDLKLGAGDGDLDFTGLQLSALDLDTGAGDCIMYFDEPNPVDMDHITLDTGASKVEMLRVGNASPAEVKLQGGVGDIKLDLTGAWKNSAEVGVTAGVGSVTLRLPDDVGVRVETRGGLSNVDAPDLQREGDVYTNAAFGDAETELRIQLTTGVGTVKLIEENGE